MGTATAQWPSSRSWELHGDIGKAQLIMYPKAGHGLSWQYAEIFVRNISHFLVAEEYDRLPKAQLKWSERSTCCAKALIEGSVEVLASEQRPM